MLFAGTWFVAYAVLNQVVFHHDPGLGDGWYTPVGHGYAIDMIDVTDVGYLHPQGDLNGSGSIAGVRRLQIVGDEAFGTEDTNALKHEGSGRYGEDGFFHLQMDTHATTPFPNEAALATYAANKGVSLRLRPVVEVFDDFRWCWFDYLAGSVLLLLPVAGLIGLLSYLKRLKRIASDSVVL